MVHRPHMQLRGIIKRIDVALAREGYVDVLVLYKNNVGNIASLSSGGNVLDQ